MTEKQLTNLSLACLYGGIGLMVLTFILGAFSAFKGSDVPVVMFGTGAILAIISLPIIDAAYNKNKYK